VRREAKVPTTCGKSYNLVGGFSREEKCVGLLASGGRIWNSGLTSAARRVVASLGTADLRPPLAVFYFRSQLRLVPDSAS